MATPAFEAIRYEVADHIATITLNQPDKLNAFGGQMAQELRAVWDVTDRDDDVRCVIVTGAGRAFCAGADLSGGNAFSARGGDGAAAQKVNRDGAGVVTLRIFESLKPVIAAVNGAAVGVGMTMLLPMDIRLASTDARFGMVFTRRGIVLEGASSYFLPRLVGISTMLEWCYSGRLVPAAEALERGLVRSVHAPGALLAAARELAKDIAENASPVSASLTRQMAWRMMGAGHPMEAHRAESLALHHRYRAGDAREGVGAFLEKRAPAFKETVPANLPDIWPDWIDPPFET